MTNDMIETKISEIYKADISAIRNLSRLANDLTNNGKLHIPGGLEIDGSLKLKGDLDVGNNLSWYNGKGRLVANSSDGANIELDNIKGKRGVHIFANYNDKGARIKINSNSGITGTDIFNEDITCKKNIRWFDGKGTLVAKDGDGANIELNNMENKRGVHIFANYGKEGARINVNDKNGNTKTDIFNENVSINGRLNIINGANKGTTHFNHNNTGNNFIRGDLLDTSIEGVNSKKLTSTKGMIGGYAIDGDGSTNLLWEGEWKLNSSEGEGSIVYPGRNNAYMNAWTSDKWNIIYLYPGWELTVWEHHFEGTSKTYKNRSGTGLPIRLHLGHDNLHDRVSSYKLKWIGYTNGKTIRETIKNTIQQAVNNASPTAISNSLKKVVAKPKSIW